MTGKLCRYGCGQYIEWSENLSFYVNQSTAVKHDCPVFHKKGQGEQPRQITAPQPQILTDTDRIVAVLVRIATTLEIIAKK